MLNRRSHQILDRFVRPKTTALSSPTVASNPLLKLAHKQYTIAQFFPKTGAKCTKIQLLDVPGIPEITVT